MTALTTTDFIEVIKDMIVTLGAELQPDGDWLPTAFYLRDEGVDIAGIDPSYLENGETKDNLAVAMSKHARECKARAVCFVVMVWSVVTTVAEMTPELRRQHERDGIHEHPNRAELLSMFIADKNGVQFQCAPVTRSSDGPPQVGNWRTHNGPMEDDRFGKVIMRVLAEWN